MQKCATIGTAKPTEYDRKGYFYLHGIIVSFFQHPFVEFVKNANSYWDGEKRFLLFSWFGDYRSLRF